MHGLSDTATFVLLVWSMCVSVNCSSANTHLGKRKHSTLNGASIAGLRPPFSVRELNDDVDVQVESDENFDIVEQPEQFMEVSENLNTPNTKDSPDDRIPTHLKSLITLSATNVDAASIDTKQYARKKLPKFLFNTDLSKIHSNSKNIENDSGNHFFYERNIIVQSELPLETVRVEKDNKNVPNGIDSKNKSKKNLRRMSFKRRLFKQLKSHKIRKNKKKKSRKALSSGSYKWRSSQSQKNKSSIANNTDFLSRDRRAVTAKKERIWDYGVIPYEIDQIFSGSHKALFKQAMRHWENFTCIKFVERDPKVHLNYIYFTVKNCGCCSFVGKRGTGRQAISIGRNCEKFGIVVHELGHVIGFWHEHTRTDRDKHIIINTANIMKGQEYNFDMLSPEDVDSLGLPYDYNSIMHYAKNTFSKNVYLDTILPIGLKEQERIEIGQRIRLSRGDIAQANLLYKCATCGQTFQQNSGQITAPHYYLGVASASASALASGASSSEWGDDGSGDGEANMSDFDKSLEACEWRITATNGERIVLQVHQLNLLQSKDCQEDYLEVRDGYWLKSPVIKRICGNATAVTIKSDSSRMLINYVNRNVIKGFRGFIANFEVMCGGEIFLTEDRRIDSPNYPLEYLPDRECVWRITVANNRQVAIKFQSFELENHDNCIYDYVEIRDGDQADSELIGIFCGSNLPMNIKTNSNQMYLKFVSDGSVQKVGFSAIFMEEIDECKFTNHGCEHECINTLGSYKCGCFAGYELQANGKCEDACGGIIDASTPHGTLNSPSYPDVYPISKECVWEIVAPANHAVFLNFTHFDLEGTKFQYTECNYDYLVIYSKLKDSRLKKIGVYCGNEIPPVINSEQNILRIEFYSDKSVQHTGFSAHIKTDVDECSSNNGGCQHHCRNTYGSYICSCRNGYTLHANRHNCTETKCKFEITNSFGVIYSPNYPENYPRNTYCFWHFQTILGHRIHLTFHEFEVENHQECIYDYVAIHDGRSENSSTLGTYCGGHEPYAVVASTNQMFMVLKTDAGLQRKGFMATYSTECGGYLRATNRTQVFYSHPRYGRRPYKRNMFCDWRIQSDPESSVKVKFLHFEVEYSDRCDFDYVELSEELSPRNKIHGRFCGNRKPPSIISYSDTIMIRFQTDKSTSLKGFVVSFVAVEPPEDDLSDDIDVATPFPGYMKNIYYTSDTWNDYDEYSDSNRKHYKTTRIV